MGNFPGVTVDKKTGHCHLNEKTDATIIDLPGTYSLYPRRSDEWVAYRVMMNADKDVSPDVILLVADASNLRRNLLFCSQIIDLKRPIVVALTMMDIAAKNGIEIDVEGLERDLGVQVVPVNPRKNKGILQLKKILAQTAKQQFIAAQRDFIPNKELAANAIADTQKLIPLRSDELLFRSLRQYFFKL